MIEVSSVFRQSGSADNFTIKLPSVNYRVSGARLRYVSIPNTIYNCRTDSTRSIGLNINFSDTSGGPFTATIPEGAYTTSSLSVAVLAALNAVGGGFFTGVEYDPTTFRFTITSSVNFTILWLTGANTTSNLHEQLGFVNTADSTTGTSLTGTKVPYLSYPEMIYIGISQLDSHMYNSGGVACCFVTPMRTVYESGIATWDRNTSLGPDEQSIHFGSPRDISSLTVTLLDEKGLPINLQGSEWRMGLQLLTEGQDGIDERKE